MATFTITYKDGCGNILSRESYDDSSTAKVVDELARLGYDQITRKGYKIEGWIGDASLADSSGLIITDTTKVSDLGGLYMYGDSYCYVDTIWEYNFGNDAYCADQSNETYTIKDLDSIKLNKILIAQAFSSYISVDVSGFSMLYIAFRNTSTYLCETGIWVIPSELKMASGGATEYQIYGIDSTGAIKSIKYKGESLTSVSFSANTFSGIKIYGIL